MVLPSIILLCYCNPEQQPMQGVELRDVGKVNNAIKDRSDGHGQREKQMDRAMPQH